MADCPIGGSEIYTLRALNVEHDLRRYHDQGPARPRRRRVSGAVAEAMRRLRRARR